MTTRRRKNENEKEFKIRKEKERIEEIFKNIDKNKLNFVMTLIERLAWLNVAVKNLEKNIDEKGTTIPYDNGGGQSGIKDNPDVKTLIQCTRNIATITKQLVDLVPPSQKKSKLDELMNE